MVTFQLTITEESMISEAIITRIMWVEKLLKEVFTKDSDVETRAYYEKELDSLKALKENLRGQYLKSL